jgi:hypothetical protein
VESSSELVNVINTLSVKLVLDFVLDLVETVDPIHVVVSIQINY